MRYHWIKVSDSIDASLLTASVGSPTVARREAISFELSALHRGKSNAKGVRAACLSDAYLDERNKTHRPESVSQRRLVCRTADSVSNFVTPGEAQLSVPVVVPPGNRNKDSDDVVALRGVMNDLTKCSAQAMFNGNQIAAKCSDPG
jgi:hypothetical protein